MQRWTFQISLAGIALATTALLAACGGGDATAPLTAQTITFSPATTGTVGTPIPLSATSSSSLAVSFSATPASVCSVSGTSLTLASAGTCSVKADQAGNTTYSAATTVSKDIVVSAVVAKVAQTTLVAVATPTSIATSATSMLSSTGGSGSGVVTFAVTTGACSITTALSVAGLAAGDDQQAGFVFLGFLPSKRGERALAVAALAQQTQAIVLLEAPHRIEALAAALAVLGERPLTKQFEEITTLSAGTFGQWLGQEPNRCRGEFVIVLHPAAVPEDSAAQQRLLRLLLAELPLKTAVRLAAEISDAPRNTLYEAALALKNQGDSAEPVPAGPSRTMP